MALISTQAIKKAKAAKLKDSVEGLKFRLEEFLFKEQFDFVNDPAKTKIAVCSRRAGKTIACAADLINTALSTPEVVCLYITLNRKNAKRIIWKDLKKINKNYKLSGIENLTELSITFPNGSIIYLSGAKDLSEISNYLGMAVKKVYIDESQSFRSYLKELVNESLGPTLWDYGGTICLIGTPSAIPVGYFHDCWQGDKFKGWSRHHWTFWNNNFITKTSGKTHEEILQDTLIARGVAIDHPSIRRDVFGEWTQDSDSLLLHYDSNKNHFDTLPNKKFNYIMGIDLGFDDADAIAVLAWSEDSPATYLVEELVIPQQGITELVKQVESLSKKYDISKMVIDQGGLGKKIAEEMRRRHQIPVEPADKVRKMENISFMNDAMRTARFFAKKDSKFAQDTYLVEIDRDKSTPDKIKVSDKYHSDIIDAALYAFKESPAYAYQVPKSKPLHGSAEWAKEEQESMFEKEMAHLLEQQEKERLYG